MASEIRVDKINSLSGVGTVTLSPTGVDIAGITTAATLRATTGIVTSLTAGSLTSLGAVSGTTGTFSGAVSGTTGTFSGDVDIADKIVHTGDTDTAIRFSGADTITAETGGSERARIDSSGRLLIGTTSVGSKDASSPLQVQTANSGAFAITIKNRTSNNDYSFIGFTDDDASEDLAQIGVQRTAADTGDIFFYTNGGASSSSERVRIDSSGRLMIGTTDASQFNSSADDFVISRAGHAGITIDSTSSHNSSVFFADGPTGTEAYRGYVQYSHNLDELRLGAAGADQVQITSGNVEITDGDLVIGTSGHGISFAVTANSSTSGATTDNELLDDYEEGGWTMTAQQGADSVTQNSANQRYTKIGNLVTVVGEVNGLTNSTSSVFTIAGLPYTVATGREGAGAAFSNNVTFPSGYNGITVYTYAGHDRLRFYVSKTGGAWHGVQGNEIGAGDIIFTATYFTN